MKSFENDGVRLDMGSGYDRALHQEEPLYPNSEIRGYATLQCDGSFKAVSYKMGERVNLGTFPTQKAAREAINRFEAKTPRQGMTYWIVVKDGVPVDLVRENPSGKTNVSIIDSMKEKKRTGRPKHIPSAYWPRRIEAGLRFVEITDMQLHNILGRPEEMAKFRRARLPSKRRSKHSAETKRRVIEARESGSTWGAITKRYGVTKSTARYWCQGVRKEAPHAYLQGRCANGSETRMDAGLKSANSDDHRPVSEHKEVQS